jgi:hypothetical protein
MEIGGSVAEENEPMAFKRSIVISLLLGLAGGLSAYVLAWGFFTAHPEADMNPASSRTIALWVTPLVFLGSLLYFAARSRRR